MTSAASAAGFCGRPGLVVGRSGELSAGTGEARLSAGTGRHVWLHGADARVHEFHGGVAFDEVCGRLGGAAVSTALTRSNARTLGGMATWLADRGVVAWRIVVVGGGVVDGVTPRLAVALPYALQALALAGTRGVHGWCFGAPHCLLGPFRGAALGSEPRAYGGRCAGCPARASCPGVDAGYLARFGDEELSPRALRSAGEGPRGGRELFDA